MVRHGTIKHQSNIYKQGHTGKIMSTSSKENIPIIMTTTMNSNALKSTLETTPSDTLPVVLGNNSVDTIKENPASTSVISSDVLTVPVGISENSNVSKKRLITEIESGDTGKNAAGGGGDTKMDDTNDRNTPVDDKDNVKNDTIKRGDNNDSIQMTVDVEDDFTNTGMNHNNDTQLQSTTPHDTNMIELPTNHDDDDTKQQQDMKSSHHSTASKTTTTTTTTTTTVIDLQRPVKRARSAYFLYLDDYRSTIQTENPGASVATVARILGQRWTAMSDTDKQPYHERAIIERERVTVATEAWKKAAIAAGMNLNANNNDIIKDDKSPNNNNTVASIILPVGRVRKICRLDPDVRGISKEALLLITKMTEMVTIQLGQECIKTAHIQNRRTLLPQDVVDVCNIRESFFFLKDDITDLRRQQQEQQRQQKLVKSKQQQHHHPNSGNASQHKGNTHRTTTPSTTTSTSKSLTDYFKPVA